MKTTQLKKGEYTTVTEYAKGRGVSRQAVMKATKDREKLVRVGDKTILVKVK